MFTQIKCMISNNSNNNNNKSYYSKSTTCQYNTRYTADTMGLNLAAIMLFQLLEFPFYRLQNSLTEVQRRTQPVQQAVNVQSVGPCPSSSTKPPSSQATAPSVPVTACSTSPRPSISAEDSSNAGSSSLALSLAESHLIC